MGGCVFLVLNLCVFGAHVIGSICHFVCFDAKSHGLHVTTLNAAALAILLIICGLFPALNRIFFSPLYAFLVA